MATPSDPTGVGASESGGSGVGGVGEERLRATAQQIVESLKTAPKEVRDDMLSIFKSFDNRLSNITDFVGGKNDDVDDGGDDHGGSTKCSSERDNQFSAAEKVILKWDSSLDSCLLSFLWEESSGETAEYLDAVDHVIGLVQGLELKDEIEGEEEQDVEFVERAENAIQLAMSRLEEEFRNLLISNALPLDADGLYGSIRRVSLSFASHEGEIDEDFENFAEVDSDSRFYHERGGSLGEDVWVDLIRPEAVAELRDIATRMIKARYEKECCQVYSSIRREALDESFGILGLEKLSIEEVQRIEWKALDERMKKWVQAVKIAVKVLLAGERRLCDQIFNEADSIRDACFNETAKGCIMQMLNFAEAVAIGKRSSEKLFRILDMYDAMADVLPELESIVTDEFVLNEARGVLAGLGDAAKGTFAEFENAVKSETSRKPMISGEIHPLTRYVMNYLKLLVDYGDTLNSLLESADDELHSLQTDAGDSSQTECMSPIAHHLLLLISSLEANLEEKSKVYEDNALQYVFLMNNIWYIVEKVKDSELAKLLGDQWVRKRRGLIRQYATSYLRAAWSKVLACLKDEGLGCSPSSASKVALKERFKAFNACFEELYRVQTAWKVPNPQLREELRICISEKAIPAYRSFVGRYGSQLESGRHAGKYVKYLPDDIENYLLDLFEGQPAVLHHPKRKST